MCTEQATYPYKLIEIRSSMGQFILIPNKETNICLHYLSEKMLYFMPIF